MLGKGIVVWLRVRLEKYSQKDWKKAEKSWGTKNKLIGVKNGPIKGETKKREEAIQHKSKISEKNGIWKIEIFDLEFYEGWVGMIVWLVLFEC